MQRKKRTMANINWMGWLLMVLLVGNDKTVPVSCIYVDEPLLYDTFPPNFVWASATSAHQIEGAWNVDGKKQQTKPFFQKEIQTRTNYVFEQAKVLAFGILTHLSRALLQRERPVRRPATVIISIRKTWTPSRV